MGVTIAVRKMQLPPSRAPWQVALCSWLAILPLAAGCSDGKLPRGKVAGTVTLDGQPLAAGTIFFVPKAGPGASGTIEKGRYQLSTYAIHDGAVVGEQRVYLALATDDSQLAGYTKEDYAAGKPAPTPVVKCPIPTRYLALSTSGLKAQVTVGENTHDFSLTTKP